MPSPQGIPFDTPIVLRSWYGRQAPEASVVGDQLKFQFLHNLQSVLGDTRLIFMPDSADTTGNTDLSRFGVTFAYDGSVAGNLNKLGSGLYWQLDGSADEADTPDVANHTFGDGAVDQAFSIVALVNPDVNNAVMTIVSKEASSSAEEWTFELNASGHPSLTLTDESASATIGRTDATATGTGSWLLLGATYDGTAALTGINIYVDGVVLDDTDVTANTYVAMENTAALVQVGAHYATQAQFWNGGIALVAVTAKALDVDEMESLVLLVNGFFDLAL